MKLHTLWQLLAGTLCVLPASGGLAAENLERLVAVSGSGEVRIAPDRASVTLGVEARRPDLQAARNEVNSVVEAFLALCDDLDVPRAQITTASLMVQPEYDWNQQTRERRLTGYLVSRQLQVDLRRLDRLGALMEGAVALGVNQAQPPQLDIGNRDELRRQALAKAAEDAQRSADMLARTLGARLGPVRRIASSDVAFQPPPRPFAENARMAMMQSGAAQTYETGEIVVQASVNAEFDLTLP